MEKLISSGSNMFLLIETGGSGLNQVGGLWLTAKVDENV